MSNVVSTVSKLLNILVLSVLLTACGEQEDVQRVDPDIRIDSGVLERHETIGHDALLPDNFYFMGVDYQYKTIEAAKKHQALLVYLSKTTGFQFKLLYSPENQSAAEMLGDDLVQFAMVDAIGLVFAANEYGAEPLAREVALDKQTVFVVKGDSSLSSLKAINKETLALSVQGSIEGDLKPRVMLKQLGFLLSNIKGVYYADSPAQCLDDVLDGKARVCALDERLVNTYVENGELRILQRSALYPTYGIANNIYVDKEVIQRVQRALLDYKQGAYIAANAEIFNRLVKQVGEFKLHGAGE